MCIHLLHLCSSISERKHKCTSQTHSPFTPHCADGYVAEKSRHNCARNSSCAESKTRGRAEAGVPAPLTATTKSDSSCAYPAALPTPTLLHQPSAPPLMPPPMPTLSPSSSSSSSSSSPLCPCSSYYRPLFQDLSQSLQQGRLSFVSFLLRHLGFWISDQRSEISAVK